MLEEMKENEQMVLLTLNVLLMPVVLALHPENYALEPEQFLETLKKLNPSAYEFKISSVASNFR